MIEFYCFVLGKKNIFVSFVFYYFFEWCMKNFVYISNFFVGFYYDCYFWECSEGFFIFILFSMYLFCEELVFLWLNYCVGGWLVGCLVILVLCLCISVLIWCVMVVVVIDWYVGDEGVCLFVVGCLIVVKLFNLFCVLSLDFYLLNFFFWLEKLLYVW